ncbi:MAG: FAD-binding protein [Geminicoccaceae bacterium]|nr:MAG: FAD-binding protein [Geminicoccaceae bacterium]
MAHHAPSSEAELTELVRETATALAIQGGSSLEGIGRPIAADDVLSLERLAGITLYRPTELVFQAKAGTPVAEAETALAAEGQALPFEPPDLRHLLGTEDRTPTLGGLVATNLSGPARVARGALRDSLIGVRFVDGTGLIMRSGGRVMKNVTGLDIVKLSAGAHGTLGVLTEVTFKVLPQAQTETTLVIEGQDATQAARTLQAAMATPLEVAAAAWLPAELAEASSLGRNAPLTLLRLQTFTDFLDRRTTALQRLVQARGSTTRLDPDTSRTLWRDVRDVRLLAEPRERAIWRLSVAPSHGPTLHTTLTRELDATGFLDWSGGLLWLAVPLGDDAGAATLRHHLRQTGGHATCIRAPAALRARIDVFEPRAKPLMAMTERLKDTFDPKRRLNPGRMYAGI